MDILVAIIIIVAIAGIVFALVHRRHASSPGVKRPGTQPFPRRRRGAVARHDPMAAAVAEHAQAMDPAEVVVAEQRLQAQARNVSARMQAGAQPAAYQAPAAYDPAADGAYADPAYPAGYEPAPGQAYPPGQEPVPGQAYPAAPAALPGQAGPAAPGPAYATDPSLANHFDPVTGERIDGHGDPANDPRYDDRRYDGRLAADWVDPREDDRIR
jgi:hypothetical protein